MMFMSELMTWCRENDIHSSPCRGSVGGSMIAYITDITDVDPLVWNTVFSRFCNAERISLADIDQDFAGEDRQRVYEYIISRFGEDKVSRILTLGTVKDKSAIDILAKGLGYSDLEKVKLIKKTFDDSFNKYTKLINENIDLSELAAAGIVTSNAPTFDDHDIYTKRGSRKNPKDEFAMFQKTWDMFSEDNKVLFYYFDGLIGSVVNKRMHVSGMT